jgi:hypothetical protein
VVLESWSTEPKVSTNRSIHQSIDQIEHYIPVVAFKQVPQINPADHTQLTSAKAASWDASSGTLTVATLPVAPSSTRGRRRHPRLPRPLASSAIISGPLWCVWCDEDMDQSLSEARTLRSRATTRLRV